MNSEDSVKKLLSDLNFLISGKEGDHFNYTNYALGLNTTLIKRKDFCQGTLTSILLPISLASVIMDINMVDYCNKNNIDSMVKKTLFKILDKAKENPIMLFGAKTQKVLNIHSNQEALMYMNKLKEKHLTHPSSKFEKVSKYGKSQVKISDLSNGLNF